MPKLLININGEQRIEECAEGGDIAFDKVIWCWDKFGEPPVKVDLGFMEISVTERPLLTENGKKVYIKEITGPNKKDVKLKQLFYKEFYLKNTKINKCSKAKKSPKNFRDKFLISYAKDVI